MRVSHFTVPTGDPGVLAVLHRMRQLVNAATGDPVVRAVASRIAIAHGSKYGYPQARGIRDYIDTRCVFLRDPRDRELLHTPRLLLEMIARDGYAACDCDDVATLGAALGKAVGLRARFVVVGFHRPDAPFRHVWTELSDPSRERWVELDVTRGAQPSIVIGRAATMEV